MYTIDDEWERIRLVQKNRWRRLGIILVMKLIRRMPWSSVAMLVPLSSVTRTSVKANWSTCQFEAHVNSLLLFHLTVDERRRKRKPSCRPKSIAIQRRLIAREKKNQIKQSGRLNREYKTPMTWVNNKINHELCKFSAGVPEANKIQTQSKQPNLAWSEKTPPIERAHGDEFPRAADGINRRSTRSIRLNRQVWLDLRKRNRPRTNRRSKSKKVNPPVDALHRWRSDGLYTTWFNRRFW